METVKLKHPFKITMPSEGSNPEEKTIKKIEIPDRIKAKHMRGMRIDKGEVSAAIDLIGAIAGLSPNQMDEMDLEDVGNIMGKLPGFGSLGL